MRQIPKEVEKIQNDLNSFKYDYEQLKSSVYFTGERVEKEKKCICTSGAIYAAYKLEKLFGIMVVEIFFIGGPRHFIYIYNYKGKYGSIAKSKYKELLGKPPIFDSINDLVYCYQEQWSKISKNKIRKYIVRNLDEDVLRNWRTGYTPIRNIEIKMPWFRKNYIKKPKKMPEEYYEFIEAFS
ncbi:MAG: hypothetical protein KC589_10795 [Nanoarchaeota archaeon]|nr:hypothetical protein [Nanoarchaeota archaeon]